LNPEVDAAVLKREVSLLLSSSKENVEALSGPFDLKTVTQQSQELKIVTYEQLSFYIDDLHA